MTVFIDAFWADDATEMSTSAASHVVRKDCPATLCYPTGYAIEYPLARQSTPTTELSVSAESHAASGVGPRLESRRRRQAGLRNRVAERRETFAHTTLRCRRVQKGRRRAHHQLRDWRAVMFGAAMARSIFSPDAESS